MNNIEIYFINTENLAEFDLNIFSKYLKNKEFKSEKRKLQFCLGRFLTEKVLNSKGIKNVEFSIKNNKPYVENSPVYFSISHSKNIILAAFANCEIGADIEFMKKRNFKEIFEHFKYNTNDLSKENFYRFWTQYEAKIKLQQGPVSMYTQTFSDDFMLSVCTVQPAEITKIEEMKVV